MSNEPKPVVFIGSSQEVRYSVGVALYIAQHGGRSESAKPLKGFGGSGVLEIVEDFDGDTYRAVYTVRFAGTIYVLHVFQKKSKHGIKTTQHDLDLIKQRLKWAREIHQRGGE